MWRRWITSLVVLLAFGGSLACNIVTTEPSTTSNGVGVDIGDNSGGPPPSIQIVSPSGGQQVRQGDDVEIRIEATDPRGVERVQLSEGSLNVSTKAFPAGTTNGEAILRWRPDRPGSFQLSAIAYRGLSFSEPATITLEVIRTNRSLTNPASGQPEGVDANSGDCVGRLLISNLRIRGGPSTNSQNLGNYNLNEQVTVVGRSANSEWVQVRRLDGSTSWAFNDTDWIELSGGGCASLPVAN